MLKGLKNGLGERELRKMENVTSVLTFEVESKWLIEGEKRLNAFSFSPDAASSLLLIDKLRTKGIKRIFDKAWLDISYTIRECWESSNSK